jgi:hypothetical protein
MKPEYDTEQEMKFNREQLQTTIPKRLAALLATIAAVKQPEDGWYLNLVTKIITSVVRVCSDLAYTIEREALPAAAWNGRNLLELWIWTKYCSASRENAWKFHEDALRDILGLSEMNSRMCEAFGVPDNYGASSRDKANRVAIETLGLTSIDSNFTRVLDAAKAVGLEKQYGAINKYLSKLAHPTAGLVVGVMHQDPSFLCGMQCGCTTTGLYCAGQCVIVLDEIVSAMH